MRTRGALILLPLMLAGCSSGTITHGIPNLHCVDSSKNIWRGGQPDAAGFNYLLSKGVTNIVKLNTQSEGSDDFPGFKNTVLLPISTEEQIFGPVSNKISQAVEAMKNPGTFVHCEFGKNRTGTAVGLYRVRVDGWTKTKARKEMDKFGWSDSLHALKDFWEDDVK
jgi:protein tyrosine/serine phosphatase